MLVYTGMRVGEVLAMKWENFDFINWTYKTYTCNTKSNSWR